MMEKNNSHYTTNNTNNNNSSSSNNHNRERPGGVLGNSDSNGLLRTATHPPETRSSSSVVATTSSDSFLQWGNRKRLRCMKSQVNKDHNNNNGSDPAHRATGRVDRRVIRSDTNNKDGGGGLHQLNGNGYLNLRQRPSSPSHRILRNSENPSGMKGHGSNGVMRGISSPDRVGPQDKRGSSAHHSTTATTSNNNNNNNNNHHHHNNHNHSLHHSSNNNNNHNDVVNNNNNNNNGSGSSETAAAAQDGKKGGSSSGSDAIPAVWPPKFVIALTNKEKEEDFIAFKGSKLPQRPKKRAKFIQRTVNLVCPGSWLCDLTLERYEVREKKISKKVGPLWHRNHLPSHCYHDFHDHNHMHEHPGYLRGLRSETKRSKGDG